MVKPNEFRALALAFPETEELSHFGKPDFRVRGKIFAGLSADEHVGTLKLTPEVQTSLGGQNEGQPFFPCAGAWGQKGWTHVRLAHVDRAVLRELLKEAYRLVAPKGLVADLEAPTAPPKPMSSRPKAKRASTKESSPRRSRG
jgi:hypothetical protein